MDKQCDETYRYICKKAAGTASLFVCRILSLNTRIGQPTVAKRDAVLLTIEDKYTLSQRVSTFKLSVTLSYLGRFT